MTEREMLRLILVNEAYILSILSVLGVSVDKDEAQKMLANAKITLDLVEKDEEENPNG